MYLLMFMTSLADVDLRRTYRAIDSIATGRIPSLSCDVVLYERIVLASNCYILLHGVVAPCYQQ